MIVASMYGYSYLTTSERFAVAEVDFEGLSRVDDEQVGALLTDLVGVNLFLAPLDAYEARLESHPRVASAELRRVVPDRIVCSIREREPVALIFTDRFLEVDAEGVVMEEDEYTPLLDLPIITGVDGEDARAGERSESVSLQRALEALELCKSLGGTFAADISELRVTERGVNIQSLTRNTILVLGESDFENRLRKYFVLRDEIAGREPSVRLIDLRFDDQVVLRGQI
jgi:cell division protein FtsQ